MQRIITGNIVLTDRVVFGNLIVEDEKIKRVEILDSAKENADVIVPGFLEIHFHGTGPYGVGNAGSCDSEQRVDLFNWYRCWDFPCIFPGAYHLSY